MTTHNRERVTEGGSDEGADEMKKQRLIVYTVRMPLKHNGQKTLFFKINVGLYARDIGNNSEHHGYKEALQDLRRVRAADPCATQPYQPRQQQPLQQQQHTHTSPWHCWNSYSWNH